MRRLRRRNDEYDGSTAAVTIRRASDDGNDREALEWLAERDSSQPLDATVLVAEVEGTVLAAISLADGRLIADPFSRTTELRSLLELRAAQFRRRARPARLPAPHHGGRRPARAALASSPPGAGGRLLRLPD